MWSKPEVAGYDELMNASGQTDFEPASTERVHHLAALPAGMDAPELLSKLVILVLSDTPFGMGRMYQIYRDLEMH